MKSLTSKINNMKSLKIACTLIIALLFQTAVAQDWVSYQSQSQVNDLVDNGTELILATDAGLVVVNKNTLEKTIFNAGNSILPKSHIQTVAMAPNGDTWIGTYDVKLFRFDGVNFQDMTTPDDPSFVAGNTQIYNLEIAPNGDLWMGTTSGIYQKSGANWSHYDANDLGVSFFEAWDLAIDDAGDIFVASVDLFKFSNNTWSQISDNMVISNYLHAELLFAENGDLYMAGDLDKIGKLSSSGWETYDLGTLVPNGSLVKSIAEDSAGDIYIQSQADGIFKLENDAWVQQNNAQTAAADNKSDYFYIDADNKMWLNSNIQLTSLLNSNLETTTISNHTIPSNAISSLNTGNDGSVYIHAGYGYPISVVDGNGNWSTIELPANWTQFENIYDILYLSNNDIWIGTSLGIHHYDGTWEFMNEGLCRDIQVNSQGDLYILKELSILKISNGTTTEITSANSPLNPNAVFLAGMGIDANDKLWIASGGDNVIQTLDTDGNWISYNETAHPAIQNLTGAFHFDVNGNVWITNDGIGAIKYDGVEFFNPFVGNTNQMANSNVRAIESDADGKLYFSHPYGITTYLDGEFDDILLDPNEVAHQNTSAITKIEFDSDGVLWWTSNRSGTFSYGMKSTSIFSTAAASIEVALYPNPASNYVSLAFELDEIADVEIAIYNSMGQLAVQNVVQRSNTGANTQILDVHSLPAGFYSIQVRINEVIVSKNLVIQ